MSLEVLNFEVQNGVEDCILSPTLFLLVIVDHLHAVLATMISSQISRLPNNGPWSKPLDLEEAKRFELDINIGVAKILSLKFSSLSAF